MNFTFAHNNLNVRNLKESIAFYEQALGLNPNDDGRVVRVPIPALTEERRREISKQVGAKLEETMIVMRSVRHEAIDAIDKAKKDKDMGEDEDIIYEYEEEADDDDEDIDYEYEEEDWEEK